MINLSRVSGWNQTPGVVSRKKIDLAKSPKLRYRWVKKTLQAALQAVLSVHPTHCKAEPQASLAFLGLFPYLPVLQWNTTRGQSGLEP